VVDGSPLGLDNIPPRIAYQHLPGSQLFNRIYLGALAAESEYIALCADDDLILQSGINSACQLLAQNKTCVVVHGRYFGFGETTGRLHGEIYRDWRGQKSLRNEPIQERFRWYFGNYIPCIYGVYRREIFLRSFRILRRFSIEAACIAEILAAMFPLLGGEICRIDSPYLIRSGAPLSRNTSVISLWNIYEDGRLEAYRNQFENAFYEFCSDSSICREAGDAAMAGFKQGYLEDMPQSIKRSNFSQELIQRIVNRLIGLKFRYSQLGQMSQSYMIRSMKGE
jgi:glycosyltransferase domain-containing protein